MYKSGLRDWLDGKVTLFDDFNSTNKLEIIITLKDNKNPDFFSFVKINKDSFRNDFRELLLVFKNSFGNDLRQLLLVVKKS